jgi:hypothetical protein
MQINDRIYQLLGTFGYHGALNDRWRGYLKSFGLAGTNDDMLYTFLGYLGFTGSLTDRWNKYIATTDGAFQGFHKLFLNFADGSETLDPRINFSRTSNATITKSDGTIGYAPHNLLTHSEQFDNAAWVKSNATVTANNVAGANGTTTADTVTATANNATILQTFTALAQPYTFSIYLSRKTGTGDVSLTVDGTTYVVKVITGTITRFDTTLTPTAGSKTVGVRLSVSGDAVYIWGAQLEIGSTATEYKPTTVKNLLGYTEAFENAAWTKSNSFVQTNLLTFSEAFDNAAWFKLNYSVTPNTTTAPDGTLTADTIVTTGGGGNVYEAATVTASTQYTFSFYALRGTATDAKYSIFNASGAVDIVAATSYYSSINASTWGRVSVTFTTPVGCTSIRCYPMRDNAAAGNTFVWGAQLVQGSVAGDYRRTDAAALPVFYPNHNGVVCAEQIQATANNATMLESYTATGGSSTFSLWMRRITGTGNVDITMDTGATYTTQAITTSWARYSITTTPAAGARTAGVRLATSGDVIQVFGAMVGDSASLDPYVLNAAAGPSAQAYYGARFDYDPVTLERKGLLVEDQRINLLLNSSIAGTNLATQNITTTAAARTLSFYGTGTVTLSGTHAATVVGLGAYPTRTTYTYTPTAGTLTLTVSGTVQYAQDELGAFATSFIPTAGASVTRAADIAVIQGSNFYSWYNQNANSLYARFDTPASGNRNIIAVDNGTANNHVKLRTEGTDPYLRSSYVGTEMVALDLGIVAANTAYKIATGYSINNYAGVINAGTVGTDTTATTPLASVMRLGTDQAGAYLNGHLYSVSSFNSNLPQSTLTGITA